MIPNANQQGGDFGVSFTWDIPLLDGYGWELCENVSRRPSISKFGGIDCPNIKTMLQKFKPHLILVTGWQSKMLVQAVLAAKRLNLPVIARGESNSLKKRVLWKKTIHRIWLHQFNAFLTIGKTNKKYYQLFGIKNDKLFDCPYFVDNEYFSRQTKSRRREMTSQRRIWSIPEDAICFLFVGKLVAKKRLMDFVNAILRSSNVHNSIHGLVVGTGQALEEIKFFAKQNQLPISFAGFLNQSEMPSAYSVADCLVLPSDEGETWGLVVNEAMACGVPAIVSDKVGCAADLVKPGITGDVFSCGNVDALSGYFQSFALNPGALKSMGENAKELVFSEYSIQRAVEGIRAASKYVLEEDSRTHLNIANV